MKDFRYWFAVASFITPLLACSASSDSDGSKSGVGGTAISGDSTAGTDGGTGSAHPLLSSIAASNALDLGAYKCVDRVGGGHESCDTIHDYSRFNYDPYNHRLVFFGGGHAATARTDVDTFDLSPDSPHSLSWVSDYPSMTCEETLAADLVEPQGFHRLSNHPATRHTYDLSVVAETSAGPRLMMFGYEGFEGKCHPYRTLIQSVASYDLTGSKTWTYGPPMNASTAIDGVTAGHWYYADQGEFDPISGMVIIIGRYGMWVYDPNPESEGLVAKVETARVSHYDGNLVFYPPTGEMYWIRRAPIEVYRVKLNREDWSSSTAVQIETTGALPRELPGSGITGYAYDSEFQRIGGGIVDRTFYRFDPRTQEWTSQEITPISDGNIPDTLHVTSHCLDYDPVNNVYLFNSGPPRARHTWAYRDTP